MIEGVDYVFHAGRLLENPAWGKALADMRAQLARERDALGYDDDKRKHVSIAETLLTKLERRVVGMAESHKVEQFHRRQEQKS